MLKKYTNWISTYLIMHNNDVTGLCLNATHTMIKQFPELKLVRGHVHVYDKYDETTYAYPHWWLVTEDGERIDPTESQFPNVQFYELWDDSLGEPTGKCPNCGEYCYDNKYMCTPKCEKEYLAYLTT